MSNDWNELEPGRDDSEPEAEREPDPDREASGDWHIDELLVARSIQGDSRAMAELYDRHSPALLRYLRNTVDAEACRELIQETFARLFAGLERIRNPRCVRAYARRIAHNVLVQYLSERSRTRRFDPCTDAVASLDYEPLGYATGRNEVRLLLKGLRRLPLEQQLLLERHCIGGCSLVELARERGIEASTMRNHKLAAKKRLIDEISRLKAEGRLIESTIEHIDDWAREVREGSTEDGD